MGGQRQAAMARRCVNDRTLAATARYLTIAGEAGLHPVTMATARSKQPDFVATTTVRVSAEAQLDPILDAIDLVLTADVVKEMHQVGKDILSPIGCKGPPCAQTQRSAGKGTRG